MHKINIQQTGGFPLETDTLDFMQNAYSAFNVLGSLAGELAIIKGCTTVGQSTVSNGMVYINGELLDFRGGTLGDNVVIRQETTTRVFEDGQQKQVYHTRYATFGSGAERFEWAAFKRITNLLELEELIGVLENRKADKQELLDSISALQVRLMPIGFIGMWAGSIAELPSGWAFCDGTNGTPDLRERFIVGYAPNGADYNNIGQTGGEKSIRPTGSITLRGQSASIPRDGWGVTGGSLGVANMGRILVGSGQNENAESLESIRAAGSNRRVTIDPHTQPFQANEQENRPPYYALAYIQFKGI